jgi:hypothetical protein
MRLAMNGRRAWSAASLQAAAGAIRHPPQGRSSCRTRHTPHRQSLLLIAMQANAMSATAFFGIPPGRVVELGTQVEI